jgi:hypothetical protein
MIQVILETNFFLTGQLNHLTIALINTGQETLTNIVFGLKLTPTIRLQSGLRQIEVCKLESSEIFRHTIGIVPQSEGIWTLTIFNFSYRDVYGKTKRIEELSYPITVQEALLSLQKAEIDVKLNPTEFNLKEWGKLEVKVTNIGNLALESIKARTAGRVECHKDISLGPLLIGETIRFSLQVRSFESGDVPISIEIIYIDQVKRTYNSSFPMSLRVTQKKAFSDIMINNNFNRPNIGNFANQVNDNARQQFNQYYKDNLAQEETNSSRVKTILILGANPKDTSTLRLDEEVREIDAGLQRAKKRELFDLKQRWAVRVEDVYQALLDFKPQIVHFSGHGTGEDGLALEDETGKLKLLDTEALAQLFELFSSTIECVVINACYSEVQAEAIVKYIPYVVGMNKAIGDKAAVKFATGFYNALGAGESVDFAYKLGCNVIQLNGISEYLTPVLKRKQ